MFNLLHHGSTGSTQDKGDDVTDHLKDRSNCFTHNFDVLNGEKLGLFSWSEPSLFYIAKLQKNSELCKCFDSYFQIKIT